VTGAEPTLAAVVAQGFGLDVEQVSAVLSTAGQNPAAAPGIPAQLTQPSAGQVLGKLTVADFTAGRLGLLSQVQSLLATAGRNLDEGSNS
jgi:hypothetical protein